MDNRIGLGDSVNASITKKASSANGMGIKGIWNWTCLDPDGNVKWVEKQVHNVTTNVGRKDILEVYFGAQAKRTLYVGLITGPATATTIAVADTMASHAGWSENTSYSDGTRIAYDQNETATSANPSVYTSGGSGTPATFSINGTATIAGGFLTTDSTKGGTAGVLVSAEDFDSPGDRSVSDGDTLNVEITYSLSDS